MYQQYLGLSEAPFSIAPDPRYLFLSDKHREALAHLLYGVGDQGGFVVLTGEVGTGKTTICRCLLQQVPDNADIAYIVNPKQSVNQLLQSIFSDLSIAYSKGATSKDLIDDLNHYLLDAHARGRNTIVIIDEAQNLSSEVLEQLRLLTNLETNEKKLLQLVLLGQPELNSLLSKPELRQLSQRVTARYHLSPLSRSEVSDYIEYRLSIAGCRAELFSSAAIYTIYKLSKGVPRLINLICDRTLLGVYATNSNQATIKIAVKAAKEVFSHSPVFKPTRTWTPVIAAACAGLLVFVLTILWGNYSGRSDSSDVLGVAALDQAVQDSLSEKAKQPSDQAQNKASKNWFQQIQYYDDSKAILVKLYQLWRLTTTGVDIHTCLNSTIEGVAIYCRQAINTASQLRAFNSPVVLSYKLDVDRFGYLLVKELSGNTATVGIGDSDWAVPIEELFNKNFAHSYLLTRIPEHIELPIFPGDSGPAIRWLQSQIIRLDENTSDTKGVETIDKNIASSKNKFDFLYAYHLNFSGVSISEDYGMDLQQKVIKFQEQLGMVGNAIIDVPLLVALNKSLYHSDPTLYPFKQHNGFKSTGFKNKAFKNNSERGVLSESVNQQISLVREG